MGKIGNIYGHSGGNFAGNVYDRRGTAPRIEGTLWREHRADDHRA